jgi:hypothetical protein
MVEFIGWAAVAMAAVLLGLAILYGKEHGR